MKTYRLHLNIELPIDIDAESKKAALEEVMKHKYMIEGIFPKDIKHIEEITNGEKT